jgi:hypothetical protein
MKEYKKQERLLKYINSVRANFDAEGRAWERALRITAVITGLLLSLSILLGIWG